MAYTPKPGEGALFKNEQRNADNQPNARGYVVAHRDIKAGEKLELAAWTRDGAKGKFQSLKMGDPRPAQGTSRGNGAPVRRQEPDLPPDFDSEIPF